MENWFSPFVFLEFIKNVQVAIVAFGLFSGGATGRSSIGSLTEGADMSLSQVTLTIIINHLVGKMAEWGDNHQQ